LVGAIRLSVVGAIRLMLVGASRLSLVGTSQLRTDTNLVRTSANRDCTDQISGSH
jgi:hypothetical protein